MRGWILCFGWILLGLGCRGQLWQRLGSGLHRDANSLFADTTEGLLYVAGNFDRAGDSAACQIAAWDGTGWQTVGMSNGGSGCAYSDGDFYSVVKWGGNIFLSGITRYLGGSTNEQFLIRWDGIRWDSCGSPNEPMALEVHNSRLFGMGMFNKVNGTKVGKIAFWRDSTQTWEPLGDSLPFTHPSQYLITSEYLHGLYYFAGNVDIPGGAYKEIASWDGNAWSSLGSGLLGDTWVNKLKVFRDQLFVGGWFQEADGNASSYLTAWDGVQWYNPLPNVLYVNQVRDLQVIDGVLYIAGGHYVWDGAAWDGPYELAKYDGVEFCSMGGKDIFPRDIAGLDGRLYVTTNYTTHPDTFFGIAEWIGGDSSDICISQPVRVTDPAAAAPLVSLFPNPTQSYFTLMLPAQAAGNASLQIRDLSGRVVLPSRRYRGGERVEVGHLPAGVYFVEVQMLGRVEVLKLVKE